MRKSNPKLRSPALLYRAAELLFSERQQDKPRLGMKEIAERLRKEFGQDLNITRQTLYPLVEEAAAQHLIRLVPPVDQALRRRLVARFPLLSEEEVEVAETTGRNDTAKVAALAAEKALAALVRIARTKPGRPVGIGLGPGRATLEFCRVLSPQLRMHDRSLKLQLVAITAGCPATLLENAPISFLNLFPEHLVQRKLGLFAETLVRVGAFKGLAGHTGVKEAFAAKADIDLVVTAMGDFNDPDDLLSIFLEDSGQDLEALRRRGWVGNVQYRPFTAKGPAPEKPRDLRAVTVFDLQDLVKMAGKRDKEVILMARQCALCGRTRAQALRPLRPTPPSRSSAP